MKTPLLIGIIGVLMVGCGKPNQAPRPPLTLEEARALISGRWEGWYAKGKEYFVIRPDGTFSQTFVQEGVTNYVAEGKWGAEPFEDYYKVRFNPFMDLSETISYGKSPRKISGRGGSLLEDELRIYFVTDLRYFVMKDERVEGSTNKIAK
ncbi:MAG: hypothetical protein EXS35_18500 [Pedosphaera sp.]|nr:hypothetical protein [Pedosphaera sp.]